MTVHSPDKWNPTRRVVATWLALFTGLIFRYTPGRRAERCDAQAPIRGRLDPSEYLRDQCGNHSFFRRGFVYDDQHSLDCPDRGRVQVRGQQIEGGPAWLTDRYDIQAKASQPAGHDEMMTMLRSLLRDRFGLRVARESRPTQGFALQVDPARDKLVPSQDGSPAQPLRFSPLGIGGKGIPLSELASMLSRYMGVPVVDETGRGGRFDFDVRIETEPGINFMTPPFLEVLRRSIEAQLGLRFRERTLTEDVIVIEEIHRPSPN